MYVTCCFFESIVLMRIRGLKANEFLESEAVASSTEEIIRQYFDRLKDGLLIGVR